MGWNTTVYTSTPNFVADPETIARNSGRQIDWANVNHLYHGGTTYTITLNDAGAAEDDVEITVVALPVALPAGTYLNFGVHSVDGASMIALTTAAAAAGATTLAVAALGHEIEDASTATYIASGSGDKVIPAGTVMVEIAATGKIVPRAIRPGSENAAMILWSTANENDRSAALSGYGCLIGGVIYEDLLPETITSWKAELVTAGAQFQYEVYEDDREV